MFKSASIFRITKLPIDMGFTEKDAQWHKFTQLGTSQERSAGWAPARGQDHAMLVELIDGHDIMRFMSESKSVPSATINEKAKERAKHIEATTGRKPGKKEMREIKDDMKLAMLPNAFPRQSSTLVWIDYKNMLLVIDSASQSRTDEIVSLLIKTFEGLAVGVLQTNASPTVAMSEWLLDEEGTLVNVGFDVGRACKLQAADESKSAVSYNRHGLDNDEVRMHVREGKRPVALALTYDDRVSFVLTESGALTKLKFLDVVFSDIASKDMGEFDTDVAIMTGELSALIESLVDALGGEVAA